jgi:hypothetical protein
MTNVTHLTFDRAAVEGVLRAYAEAWSSLQGSIFASERRAEETRAILTQSIIEMTERGERDPDHLRDNALRQFGMA